MSGCQPRARVKMLMPEKLLDRTVARAKFATKCLDIDMPVSGGNTNNSRAIGDVVDVVRPESGVCAGTIVEDFVDVLSASNDLGRDWAQPRRWAVALETGVLVFVDDADLDDADLDDADLDEGDTDDAPRKR